MNVLYALLMRNRDETERAKLDFELDMPTPGEMAAARDDFWYGHEDDGAAFRSAQQSGMGGIF